ncbi:MAG: GSCFA domain-containing protein [Prevotella sp.]|nr:GSCFA domain-containing protein [Prevotella sp.]
MQFRTVVDIPKPDFRIEPREEMLFVGSCFADSIGRRFAEEQFRATVNPFGTMYNPASVLHTIEKYEGQPRIAFLTLGTNHVYRLKETGEIVDNCQKRPAALFQEEELSVDQCADYLQRAVDILRSRRPDVHVVVTVSPIRYRKYGYHESQLSKATLLLAVDRILNPQFLPSEAGTSKSLILNSKLVYFPAYEIVMDELRDYRFYESDMLHPSSQAVEYIWERLVEHYFSDAARQFLQEWAPLKAALAHRPFNPDSEEYQQFMAKTRAKVDALLNNTKHDL